MNKKLLLIFTILIVTFSSCKKDDDNKTEETTTTGFEVSAKSSAAMSIDISAYRGTNSTTPIEYVSLTNVTAPYKFTSTKLQVGDFIIVRMSVNRGNTIEANAYWQGRAIGNTYLANDNGRATYTWQTTLSNNQ